MEMRTKGPIMDISETFTRHQVNSNMEIGFLFLILKCTILSADDRLKSLEVMHHLSGISFQVRTDSLHETTPSHASATQIYKGYRNKLKIISHKVG